MNQTALSDKIKSLRTERAWTQEQLAQAAELNVRTIQRLEGHGSHSSETLLSVAAALDIDVTILTELISRPSLETQSAPAQIKRGLLTANQYALAGAIIMLPAVYFVLANILKYYLGIPWLSVPLEILHTHATAWEIFGIVSPFMFLGGVALAILLNLWAMTEIRIGRENKRFSFRFVPTLSNLMIVSVGGVMSAIMLLYGIVENIHHP